MSTSSRSLIGRSYRLAVRPAASDSTQTAAFPLYLEVPALPSSPRDDADAEICPLQVGTFVIAEQFQCQSTEQESTSASQAAAMLGGTLAAALLVYSLLPYVRSRNRKRRRTRSRTHSQTSEDRLSWSSDQQIPSTPTTPNGASRRMWGGLDDDGIEPARAHRDELRERKNRRADANGSAVSDTGSELLLAKLPDFNGERRFCYGKQTIV
ncbi:unnamed protein product [Phytophthora fragariaefolia]|uniref:Unnamed protein product n=1 Tax=Phytophthora fragariaefolia TaxID=1490495 RepID=A0A9W6YPI6_9STRA|nr:unnamed protein product [Phytophthora fragariaefolia]